MNKKDYYILLEVEDGIKDYFIVRCCNRPTKLDSSSILLDDTQITFNKSTVLKITLATEIEPEV